MVIDSATIYAIYLIASVIISGIAPTEYVKQGIMGLFVLVLIIAYVLYFAISESSVYQGTLGKRVMKIKVADLNGERISFGRALARNISKILSVPLYIGFIMAGVTKRKQGLHDMITGCLVLHQYAFLKGKNSLSS